MIPVQPHAEEYLVRGFDCGYGGPLRPLPLFDFLQETAGNHAEILGIGMEKMQAEGKTWMISRIDLRADELPRAGERVSVETWPAGRDRLFALRDFVMKASDGRVLVRAVYAYLIVDLATRRPLRPERFFGENEPRGEAPHPVADFAFSLPELGREGAAVVFSQRASARHIDNNGHVNNGHIANWLLDAAPPAERGEGRLKALRIEFDGEILSGDSLEARWGRRTDGGGREILSELVREGEVVARAASTWE